MFILSFPRWNSNSVCFKKQHEKSFHVCIKSYLSSLCLLCFYLPSRCSFFLQAHFIAPCSVRVVISCLRMNATFFLPPWQLSTDAASSPLIPCVTWNEMVFWWSMNARPVCCGCSVILFLRIGPGSFLTCCNLIQYIGPSWVLLQRTWCRNLYEWLYEVKSLSLDEILCCPFNRLTSFTLLRMSV